MGRLQPVDARVSPESPTAVSPGLAKAEADTVVPAAPPVEAPEAPAPKLLGRTPNGCGPTSPNVALRIKADGAAGSRVVQLPKSSFHLVDGKPTRLSGPNTTVIADAPLYSDRVVATLARATFADVSVDMRPSKVTAVTADACGTFDAADVDVSQTTAFYAAERVRAWAARTSGRIEGGAREPLPVTVHAWVTKSPEMLNAAYDLHFGGGVLLGTYGDVRDGRPTPYTGAGVPTLEFARLVAGYSTDVEKQVEPRERDRRLAFIERIDTLLQRGARDEAQSLIQRELKREPRRGPVDPTIPDIPAAAALRHLSGRHLYFGMIEASADLLKAYRPATNAYFDSASDQPIAAHEVGHAELDRQKPALSTPAGLAFHEAFGDLAAIASRIDDDETAAAILAETGGDLRRSSSGSRIVDKLEDAMNETRYDRAYMARDASDTVYTWTYTEGDVLTSRDPRRMPEAHALSRIISTSMYELFADRANASFAGTDESGRVQAMRRASDEVSNVLHDSVAFLPEDGGTLTDVVGALLAASRNVDTSSKAAPLEPQLRAIFERRGMVAGVPPTPASMKDLPHVTIPTNADAASVLTMSDIASVVARVSPPEGARGPVIDDVSTSRGLRVLRLRYERAEGTASPFQRRTWTAALTFDATGTLVAASHSAR